MDYAYTSDHTNLEINLRLQGRPRSDTIALQPNGTWVRHEAVSQIFSMLGGFRFCIDQRFVPGGDHSTSVGCG